MEGRTACLQPPHVSPGAAVCAGPRLGAKVCPLDRWRAGERRPRDHGVKAGRTVGGLASQGARKQVSERMRLKRPPEGSCE